MGEGARLIEMAREAARLSEGDLDSPAVQQINDQITAWANLEARRLALLALNASAARADNEPALHAQFVDELSQRAMDFSQDEAVTLLTCMAFQLAELVRWVHVGAEGSWDELVKMAATIGLFQDEEDPLYRLAKENREKEQGDQ